MEPLLLLTSTADGQQEGLGPALEVLRTKASVEVCQTSNPGELDGALHRAGSRPVVVAGGDATLHAVIATMFRRNDLRGKSLGVLPLGIGHDFARTVGIPLDPVDAAEALLTSTPRPMDLIVDELGEVVVNNVHAGAGTIASPSETSWKERLGPFGLGLVGYPVGFALAAINPPSLRVRVEVDGEVVIDVDRQVALVSIGNRGSVGNGSADVMISLARDPLARLGRMVDLLHRRDDDDVLYLRGTQVSICGEPFLLSADGEISGPERRRTWHVEPAAYSLLAPA